MAIEQPKSADKMVAELLAKRRRHNIIVAPVVLLVRAPVLLPFWLLARLGEAAEHAGEWIGSKLPGFKQ